MTSISHGPVRRSFASDLPRTSALFRRVRRGLRVRAALRATEPAAVAGLVLWTASMAADAAVSLSPSSRLVALAVTCAATSGTFLWCLARGAAGRIGPVYLAARVETLHPEFAGRLVAAVELAAPPRGGPGGHDETAEGPASPATRLVYRQAEALVGGVDPARVVAAEAQGTTAHKYLLWSMALVLAAALVIGRDFPEFAARSLFPWLWRQGPEAAFFWIRPRLVEVEEGERFTVEGSLRGPEPERVVLELASSEGDDASGGDGPRGATRVRMGEGSIPQRWRAEAGPFSALEEGPRRFRLVAEYGEGAPPVESEWFPVRLLRTPRVRSVSVRYLYPPYTGRPDRLDPGGAIDAPVGTTAAVELVPQRPLEYATAVLEGRRMAMERVARGGDRGEAWGFKHRVTRSGSYRVELESATGVRARTESYPVIARPDRAPRCEASFVEPSSGDAAEVLSRGAAFRVRAADDFGLEELVLVVRRGGESRAPPTGAGGAKPPDAYYIPVPGFAAGARDFSRELRVPPQVLPVEPGITYTYYVRAADAHPPSPHLVASREKTFRVSRTGRPKALLADGRTKKRRPPLLEPQDEEPDEPLGPRADDGRAGGDKGGERPSRSLAGLDDGEKRPPSGRSPGTEPKQPGSPYASGPGLGTGGRDEHKDERGGRPPKETASSSGRSGAGGPGGERPGEGDGAGPRRERPQLPGQGGLPEPGRAPPRERTAAGSASGSRQGPGGAGGRPGSRREAPDATGSGPEGGGRADAGLREKRRRDGGIPTGAETGIGLPMPETVDEEAVAALTVERDELDRVRVPPRVSPNGEGASGPAESAADLGRGLGRRLSDARGRDRVTISKDDLPTPAVVRSRPVGRMYRALVDEYFRRLEELTDGER